MPFSAINTYEQELKQRNERHTLELQLEQAMQVYQDGLEAQRQNKVDEAHDCYTRLFKFDVLKPKKFTEKQDTSSDVFASQPSSVGSSQLSAKSLQLGPAIRLRAMALKNFALLLLSLQTLDTDTVNKAVEYLAEALDLVGTDDKEKIVLPSLIPIAWALGFRRIARMGLEILVQSDVSSALIPLDEWSKDKHACNRLFGPRTIEYLRALDYVKSIFMGVPSLKTPKLLLTYSRLSSLNMKQQCLSSFLNAESSFDIFMTAKSWSNLISSVTDALNSSSKRGKRKSIKDQYAWSQRDLWSANFVGSPLHHNEAFGKETTIEVPAKQSENQDVELSLPHTAESPPPSVSPIMSPQLASPQTPRKETSGLLEEESISTPLGSPKDASKLGSLQPLDAQNKESTPETEHSEQLKLVASPVKRRRIDRIKRSTLALPADFGIVDSSFSAQFNAYVSLVDSESLPTFFTPVNLFLNPSQDIPPELVNAAKLRDLLSNWDARESNQFLLEAACVKPQKDGIMPKLQRGEPGRSSEDDVGEDEDDLTEDSIIAESVSVDKFIAAQGNMHIQQVRWSLGRALLQKLASGGQTKPFGQTVLKFIDGMEGLLWAQRRILESSEVLMIFALYTDSWIKTRNADLEIEVSRWMSASAMYPCLPHAWITAFANQEREFSSPESSVSEFEGILLALEADKDNINLSQLATLLTHLSEIPPLSVASLHMQISKFKAAAAFERVLTSPGSSDHNVNHKDDILLLEAMLMPETHVKPDSTSASEFEAIQNFLGFAQPQFKMGLWYNLLEKYEANGSFVNSFHGLTKIFLEGMRSLELGEPLLPVLSVAHDVGKRLLPLLEKNSALLVNHWTLGESLEFLRQAVNLLQTLHLFLLYDDAVNSNLLQKPITPSWPRALLKFRELVVMWWCIFYRFWLRCVPKGLNNSQETVNDILSIIHERLGNLGYCGVANSCLLNLHLREIARVDWDGSALDFSQCLKCKFGLSLSMNGDVANHHTVAQPVSHEEAELFLPYIMRLILHHRSFQQTLMRMDTRAVIDEFSKAYNLKAPSMKHQKQIQNIEAYLDQDFSPKILKRSWLGQGDQKISYAVSDDVHGIWLVQAGVMMNQYRIRRRQAYSAASIRTEALFSAISLYVKDIAASPTRIESWVGAAQAYLYICEDCLTFGNELIVENTPEIYCKKALLAASQAISLQVSDEIPGSQWHSTFAQKENYETARQNSWPLFGYLLMLAVMPPLARQPLIPTQRPFQPLLVELPSNQMTRLGVVPPTEISDKLALTLSLRCLSEQSDLHALWVNSSYQTRVAFQLDSDPLIVLKYAFAAKEASPTGVSDDTSVEILHCLWHYHRNKRLDDNAIKLRLDKIGAPEERDDLKEDIKSSIQSKLRWLLKKNKWLHRPWYILAKIQELDNADMKAAQEELMHLFSLKSPSKPLIIWNVDSDLPGQHGVYITQYVKYMADLMYANRDSGGLLLMARRFRRVGAEMWDHQGTYDSLFSQTCSLAHQLIPGESTPKAKYSETLMSQISEYNDRFDWILKQMSAELEKNFSENDKWTHALFYAIELRRLHFGSGTIAQADELLIVVFLSIFIKFTEEHADAINTELRDASSTQTGRLAPDEANKPAGNPTAIKPTVTEKKPEKQQSRKKIIRKDVINSAQQYIKPVQSLLAKIDDLHIPNDLT